MTTNKPFKPGNIVTRVDGIGGSYVVIGLSLKFAEGRPSWNPKKVYGYHVQSIANPAVLATYSRAELELAGTIADLEALITTTGREIAA